MHPIRPLARGLTATAIVALLTACVTGEPASMPSAIAVAAQQKLALKVAAHGVQIYECRVAPADGDGDRAAATTAAAWALKGADARLFDANRWFVGHHGAGPTWAFDDGTRVSGRVKAVADAPSAGAIPWLLLEARAEAGSPRLNGLRAIQRIHTQGGSAPKQGCTAHTAGRQVRVPYSADYLFFIGG